jgi:peptidyl-prolyl cis-trans isomerase A (cyclophilin A)
MLTTLIFALLAAPTAPKAAASFVDEVHAIFQTSEGEIEVRLLPKEAPKTVDNFVMLAMGLKPWLDPKTNEKVKRPLYDGTIFHRVIPGFMIQGGDPLGTGMGGTGETFEDEFGSGRKFDQPYLLAMANSGPNTNSSQFFITEVPTPHLDGRHTIFGIVIRGQELVAQIARKGNGAVTLNRVRIVQVRKK